MAGVRRVYGATQLTGVGTGSLADIDASILKPNDMAIVKAETTTTNTGHASQFDGIYFYRYAEVGDVENAPKIIEPNNAGGTGRWLLISPTYFMENITVEPGKQVIVNEILSNSTDLTLAYNDGSVYLTIGNNTVTIDAPTLVNYQITSTVNTGTPPFVINSTTQVSNLNAQYIGGVSISDISRLSDTTNKYSVLPQVTNATTVYPTLDAEFATKKYVDDELASGGSIDHGTLLGLSDDDHPQYILADSTRAFINTSTYPKVSDSGVMPSLASHLTTKAYVDQEILNKATNVHIRKDATVSFTGIPRVVDHTIQLVTQNYHLATKYYVDNAVTAATDHGVLTGLGDDDHTQYSLVNGNRNFTNPVGYSNSTVMSTATGDDFTTKTYVDNQITAITDVYIVKDGSIAFTANAQVANTGGVPDVTPSQPYHLATVDYVDGVVSGGSIDHGSLLGLSDNDHTQYALLTGASFTGVVTGITPLTNPEFATKGYVDGEVITSHSSLLDLSVSDDHTQYIHVDGRRVFDTTTNFPGVANDGTFPNDTPLELFDLTTKEYVDDGISTLGTTELFDYIDIFGRHEFLKNQPYVPVEQQNPWIISGETDLVNKDYVDYYIKRFVVSGFDGLDRYFADKVEINDLLTATTINSGADTGIFVGRTTERLDGISRASITNGGVFFVYDTTGGGWTPQTFSGLYDGFGNGSQSITETWMYPPNGGGGTDTDIRIDRVIGDVEYMEIVSQSLAGTPDDTYDFVVAGNTPLVDSATWRMTVVSNVITKLEKVSSGSGYSYANDVVNVSGVGGTFTLRPYVVGRIARFKTYLFGTDYPSSAYQLTAATQGSFTLSGYGTTGSGLTLTTTDNLGSIDSVTVTAGGTGYSYGEIVNIDGGGGDATVRVIDVVGGVVQSGGLEIVSGGSGYTGGSGVTTTILGEIDVIFINPINEKVKWRHYNPTLTLTDPSFSDYVTTPVSNGYDRQLGNVISTIRFDEFGHIREIVEEGVGGSPWLLVDETDTLLVLTANTNYFALTDTSSYELRLPNTTIVGTTIVIDDYFGNSSVNNITVADAAGGILRVNGSAASHTIIDVNDARCTFTWIGIDASANNIGWRLKVN